MFFHADDFSWHEPPGHFGALSQYLVNPENADSNYFDFRVSRYPAGGRVETHVHAVAEHVYYVMGGSGNASCGDENQDIRSGSVMFVPAGVPHSIANTGSDDLFFVVVTSPPSDIVR